jgi:hypothetical protein
MLLDFMYLAIGVFYKLINRLLCVDVFGLRLFKKTVNS